MGSVTSRLQNVKSQCRYAYCKLLAQELLELGVFSLTAEISGFLRYQLQVEGIVLYFWSSLDLLKVELWFVIGEFKFPQRTMVLLALESDAAYNQVKWLLCKKKYSVCLVWCYKTRGNREQDLRSYWQPEGCLKQWYDKTTGDVCLQEVWAGGAMMQWHCCILYLGQVLQRTEWKHENRNIMMHTTDHTIHSHSR